MGAQLAAAQQREAQARQDTEEAHRMFEDLSVRVKLDEEEAAKIKKKGARRAGPEGCRGQ